MVAAMIHVYASWIPKAGMKQNCLHFAGDILKFIFLTETLYFY